MSKSELDGENKKVDDYIAKVAHCSADILINENKAMRQALILVKDININMTKLGIASTLERVFTILEGKGIRL